MPRVRTALMIEGQEGVTWPQWVALAQTAEQAGIEALFRSDHYSTVTGRRGRLARRVDDAGRARGRDGAAAARDARLAGDVPAPIAARPRRRHGRPHLGRSRRARHGRRLDGARAPGVRLPVPALRRSGGNAGRADRDRSPPVDGGQLLVPRRRLRALRLRRVAEAGAAAAPAAARRRQGAPAHARGGRALGRRVQRLPRRARVLPRSTPAARRDARDRGPRAWVGAAVADDAARGAGRPG